MKGSRLQKTWFIKKCLVIGVILLFNGFVYVPVVNADDTDNDLVFIHHSCGQNWLNSGILLCRENENTNGQTPCQIGLFLR